MSPPCKPREETLGWRKKYITIFKLLCEVSTRKGSRPRNPWVGGGPRGPLRAPQSIRKSCCFQWLPGGSGPTRGDRRFERAVTIGSELTSAGRPRPQRRVPQLRHRALRPPNLPVLHCPFSIFSANSIPRTVAAAWSNRVNPGIGPMRCSIRRWSRSTVLFEYLLDRTFTRLGNPPEAFDSRTPRCGARQASNKILAGARRLSIALRDVRLIPAPAAGHRTGASFPPPSRTPDCDAVPVSESPHAEPRSPGQGAGH
jgi:hypothetical protein